MNKARVTGRFELRRSHWNATVRHRQHRVSRRQCRLGARYWANVSHAWHPRSFRLDRQLPDGIPLLSLCIGRYVHLDSNNYPQGFLSRMVSKGWSKAGVVWWKGHAWTTASAK